VVRASHEKLIWRATLLALAGVAIVLAFRRIKDLLPPSKMPPATQALMDKLGQADRDLLQILYLVRNRHLHAQATAVLNLDGVLLTDASVLAGSRLGDVEVRSSRGQAVPIKGMEINRDLGVGLLFSTAPLKDGIDLSQSGEAGPGDTLYTWGFPEDCEPPQPLLCMGFVAGYKASTSREAALPLASSSADPLGKASEEGRCTGGGTTSSWAFSCSSTSPPLPPSRRTFGSWRAAHRPPERLCKRKAPREEHPRETSSKRG